MFCVPPQVKALIPRRTTLSAERGVLIIAATQFKQKSGFYIFVQVGCTAQRGGAKGLCEARNGVVVAAVRRFRGCGGWCHVGMAGGRRKLLLLCNCC